MEQTGNIGIFPGENLPEHKVNLDKAHRSTVTVRQGQAVSLTSESDKFVTIDSQVIKDIATPGEVSGPSFFHASKVGKYVIDFTLTDTEGQETNGSFTLLVLP